MDERLIARVFDSDDIISIECDTKRGFECARAAVEDEFFKFAGVVGGDGGANEVCARGPRGEIMASGRIHWQLILAHGRAFEVRENVEITPNSVAFLLKCHGGCIRN